MTTIRPKLVFDDLLGVEDSINFAVEKGPMAINYKAQKANSATPNSLKFDIVVPSPTMVFDTRPLVKTQFSVTYTGLPANGKYLVNFGASDCIAPFPIHQNCSVIRANINGSALSTNINTYLDAFLRCLPKDILAQYSSMTPTQLDEYANYADLLVNNFFVPNSPFSDYGNSWEQVPRGAFKIDSIVGNTVGDGAVKVVTVTFTSVEPILMAPFHLPNAKSAGLYGVGNVDLEYILEGLSNTRMCRWIHGAHGPGAKAITDIQVSSASYVYYKVATPNPADRILPSVSVVPLQSINPHITAENVVLDIAATATTYTSAVTLSSMPDKLMIFVRNRKSLQTSESADAYATITGVRITLGSQDNLLGGATPEQLFLMSKESGLEQMNYQQFTGFGRRNQTLYNVANPPVLVAQDPAHADFALTGSILLLDVGKCLTIPESYYCPGSQGSFQIACEISYKNNLGYAITPEVVVCDIQSGVLVTSNRVSTPMFGLISKEVCLKAIAEQEPIFHSQLERAVGAGFWSRAKAFASKHLPGLLTHARNALGNVKSDNPNIQALANVGHTGLKSLGYGENEGGYLTGGEMTGGRASNKRITKHLM